MSPSRPGRPVPVRRSTTPRPGPTPSSTTEPATAEPAKPEPGKSKPATTEPAKPEPGKSKPATTEPATSKPATTEPATTKTAPSSNVTTYTAGRRALGVSVRPSVVSAGSEVRFAERLAARQRLVRKKALLISAGVVLALAAAWVVLLSPVFALEPTRVTVTGAGTVVAVADVTTVVDRVAGIPLPRLDTVGLRDRILDVPGVRSAKVTRTWPHGLAIVLVSREPVAAVPQTPTTTGPNAGGPAGFTLLDTDGYQVGWAAAPPDGLPVVSVPIDGENTRTLTAVLTVLQALPAPLRAEVATVQAATQDTVQMGLRDGATVTWGSASQAALKVAVLQALRAAPESSGASEFDVSAPTLPITR